MKGSVKDSYDVRISPQCTESYLLIRFNLVNSKIRFTPARITNARVPAPESTIVRFRRSKESRGLGLTQTSTRGVFEAFPQIMNLNGEFTSVSPHDLLCTLQSFFVVREGDQVLK